MRARLFGLINAPNGALRAPPASQLRCIPPPQKKYIPETKCFPSGPNLGRPGRIQLYVHIFPVFHWTTEASKYNIPRPSPHLSHRAARVKGFFISTLPPRPESIESARPSIQSSELGPPPPSCKRLLSPPLWSQGGNTLIFRGEGGGGGGPIPTMGHTLWYSGYTTV